MPAAVGNTNDRHVRTLDTVQDHVIANRKRPYAGTEIIARAAGVRVRGEQVEPLGDRLDYAVGAFEIAACEEDVEGDVLEIRFRLRCEAIRHQRAVWGGSAAMRRRRRCFISSISAGVDAVVNARPSPR